MKKFMLLAMICSLFMIGNCHASSVFVIENILDPAIDTEHGSSVRINMQVGGDFDSGKVDASFDGNLLTSTFKKNGNCHFDYTPATSDPSKVSFGFDILTKAGTMETWFKLADAHLLEKDSDQSVWLYWGDDKTNPELKVHFAISGVDKLQAVPIPGAVWLLGSGLLGVISLRKKLIKVTP